MARPALKPYGGQPLLPYDVVAGPFCKKKSHKLTPLFKSIS
jgi:hypothetical protein